MKNTQTCPNHPLSQALLTCSLCEDKFCNDCLQEIDSLIFCIKHVKLFKEGEWVVVKKIHCSNDENSEGLILFKKKKELWDLKKIPTFFIHKYSQCEKSGDPLSFVTLFCLRNDLERAQSFLN